MVLLKIHPVAKHKNSTSINLTDWFAVVVFKSQPRFGTVDRNAWCISRNAWRYLVFLGPDTGTIHSLQEKQLPW